eukprot:15465475-Alexandrium_andersonii.AAC.1
MLLGRLPARFGFTIGVSVRNDAEHAPDEALESGVLRPFRPSSAGYGLRIAHGLRIAAGFGVRPDCRIMDLPRTGGRRGTIRIRPERRSCYAALRAAC